MNLSVEKYEIVNAFISIKWNDGQESHIPLKKLRESCPCATCSGEMDALGNLHIGHRPMLNPASFQLLDVRQVGYYALQPFWKDGHNSGIYRLELLRELGELDRET